jgi:hypothetical protein
MSQNLESTSRTNSKESWGNYEWSHRVTSFKGLEFCF